MNLTQVPQGARLLPLAENTKVPTAGGRGHLDAVPAADLTLQEGQNYGIALDNSFIVVDFDRDAPSGLGGTLPPTWSQRTRRGRHLLYRIPEGYQGTNVKFAAGDIKCRGYIVGPNSRVAGHQYELIDGRDPVEAPLWLLEYIDQQRRAAVEAPTEVISAFGEGDRNLALVRFAGLLRRMGLDEAAIGRGLVALNKTIVDPPLTLSEVRAVAAHAAKYAIVTEDTGPLRPEGWVRASDISFVGPPTRWWVRGFVPKGELVMMYGKGGLGKSTWGSWLAQEVTVKGGRFAFAGVEEPFSRFAARSVMGGADGDLLLCVPQASRLLVPRDADKLREVLEITKTDVLYMDSIYAHFESVAGMNTAERARRCLSPLAEMAQEMGKTIIAVFHENKMGQLLGSLEMENVARISLHATREEGRPLFVAVDKTNLRRPDYHMTFVGQEVAISDPHTGEVQMEELEDGSLVPDTIFVARRGENVSRTTINLEDIEEPAESQIESLLMENPELSNSHIVDQTGFSRSYVGEVAAEVRRTLGLVRYADGLTVKEGIGGASPAAQESEASV